MTRIACLCRVVLFAGLVPVALAQWEVNGPNARLKVQDKIAGTVAPTTHDVVVFIPGLLDVKVETGVNPAMPLILALSAVDPTGAAIRVIPGVGIINVGLPALPLPSAIVLVGDGIGHTVNPITDPFFVSSNGSSGTVPTFQRTWSVPATLCGQHFAWQAVVGDPSLPPFHLDMSECADTQFTLGKELVLGLAANVPQNVTFAPGRVFWFHGQAHADIWVNAAGYVNFGGASSVTQGGFSTDARGFLAAEPAIAAWLTDWNPRGFGPTDGVLYREIDGVLEIKWGEPAAMPSGASGVPHSGGTDVNRFSIRLELGDSTTPFCAATSNAGIFEVRFDAMDPLTVVRPGDGLLGQTPGGAASLVGAMDGNLHRPAVIGPAMAAFEEHDRAGLNHSVVGHDGAGAPRYYNDIRSWNGHALRFLPVATAGAAIGSAGYFVQPTAPPVADVVALYPASLSTAGGDMVTLVGKFFGFNGSAGTGGTVTATWPGSASPCAVIGIFDSSGTAQPALPLSPFGGPYRDGEGLVIQTPSFGGYTGPASLHVAFVNGLSRTLTTTVHSGIPIDVYQLGHDAYVRHRLHGMTVSFFGQAHDEFFVSSNGLITFHAGSIDATPTTTELFAGVRQAGNPAIAALWADFDSTVAPATAPSRIVVTENTAAGTVEVQWLNNRWRQTGGAAGHFAVRFEPMNVLRFDHSAVLQSVPPPFALPALAVVGFSDAQSGPDVPGILDNYLSPQPGESLAHPLTVTTTDYFRHFNGPFNGLWSARDLIANGLWLIN